MKEELKRARNSFGINPFLAILILTILYITSVYNYLLFHSLAEIFSVVIACMIFIIGWHSRYYIKNNYLLYISLSYIFIALLDMLHTLSYPGMSIFKDYDYYANQLWIAARYMESLVLLTGFLFIKDKEVVSHKLVTLLMSTVTVVIIASIFKWKTFPVCFIDGVGLTTFKVYSEYIICIILVASAFLLYKNKDYFNEKVYRYLLYSIAYTIVAELAFTFYISNYGISNLVGHYFKIFSFYCIYRSMIVTGLEYPQETIFKELVDKENELKSVNKTKDQLYSIMMHDLRGPINSLHDFMHDAKDNLEDYTKEDLKFFISAGHRSVSGMNSLVNNLYTWIRSQSNEIEPMFETIELNELITAAVEPLIRSVDAKKINLKISCENTIKLNTDKELLKIVIRNLVNNAIKFTEIGGKITINAHKSVDNAIITVQDNGKGMSREILDSIFDVDRQFTSRGTSGELGSGLGLKVCKELLEKIKGSINIDSKLSSGTTITVIINSI